MFKISERVNSSASAATCWQLIHWISLAVCLCFSVLYVVGTELVTPRSHYLRDCLASTNLTLDLDQVGFILTDPEPYLAILTPLQPALSSPQCRVYRNPDFSELGPNFLDAHSLQFSFGRPLTNMDGQAHFRFAVDRIIILMDNKPGLITRAFYGFQTMLTREMIDLVDAGILAGRGGGRLRSDLPIFVKADSYYTVGGYQAEPVFAGDLWEVFHLLGTLTLAYALTSIVTAFYIYVTVVASPAVILLILEWTPYGRGDQLN